MLIYICIYISLKNVLVFTVCIETIHIHIDITYLHTYMYLSMSIMYGWGS